MDSYITYHFLPCYDDLRLKIEGKGIKVRDLKQEIIKKLGLKHSQAKYDMKIVASYGKRGNDFSIISLNALN